MISVGMMAGGTGRCVAMGTTVPETAGDDVGGTGVMVPETAGDDIGNGVAVTVTVGSGRTVNRLFLPGRHRR